MNDYGKLIYKLAVLHDLHALGLSQDMYNLLLYVQDKASRSLSPVQHEQTERFERILLRRGEEILGDNGGAAN
jgi:hypothetical protein